jgi:hypothetical protein
MSPAESARAERHVETIDLTKFSKLAHTLASVIAERNAMFGLLPGSEENDLLERIGVEPEALNVEIERLGLRWAVNGRPAPLGDSRKRAALMKILLVATSLTGAGIPTMWSVSGLPDLEWGVAALQQELPSIASAPNIVMVPEDTTILSVLATARYTLTYSEIVRGTHRLLSSMGGPAARKIGLVLLSETKLGERIPILEENGLVARPLGAKGKPTKRKGVGITDKGRSLLETRISSAGKLTANPRLK